MQSNPYLASSGLCNSGISNSAPRGQSNLTRIGRKRVNALSSASQSQIGVVPPRSTAQQRLYYDMPRWWKRAMRSSGSRSSGSRRRRSCGSSRRSSRRSSVSGRSLNNEFSITNNETTSI